MASTNATTTTICTICREAGESLTRLPCGDVWCATCLYHVFRAAHAEVSWPPRCCDGLPISLALIAPTLPPALLQTFEARSIEFETPAGSRTYCAGPQCGQFVPMEFVFGGVATCKACGEQTCMACGAKAHEGACVLDQSLQETLELAVQEGWQRCSECGRVVDRMDGCPHMTCPCGYDFCYHCGGAIHVCNGCPGIEQPDSVMRQDFDHDLHGEELPHGDEDPWGFDSSDYEGNSWMVDDTVVPSFGQNPWEVMRNMPELRIIRGTGGSMFRGPE